MATGRQDENLLNALLLFSYFSGGLLMVISFDAVATIYHLARVMGWGG